MKLMRILKKRLPAVTGMGIIDAIKNYSGCDEAGLSASAITLSDLEEWVKALESSKPLNTGYTIPAHDYPSLTDVEFLAMVTHPGAKFLGSTKGIAKMEARCERLGIKTL